MRFISDEFPAMTEQYAALYARKYVAKDYGDRVKRTVGMLRAKYGLGHRARRGDSEESRPVETPAPVQETLTLGD
jgi:hypothetical protein